MAERFELAPEQHRALGRLRPLAERFGLYLAGGTALAFHLHHRQSLDVDLFSVEPALDLEQVRRSLVQDVSGAEIDSLTDATLRCRVEGVPVDLVSYPYRLLTPAGAGPDGIPVAGLMDLAAMKLSAVSRRGIRRDFWDLFEMFEREKPSLSEALDAYRRRFGLAEADLYHVLRSLTYFEDAEADQLLPLGLSEDKWQRIKLSIAARARGAFKSQVSAEPE